MKLIFLWLLGVPAVVASILLARSLTLDSASQQSRAHEVPTSVLEQRYRLGRANHAVEFRHNLSQQPDAFDADNVVK